MSMHLLVPTKRRGKMRKESKTGDKKNVWYTKAFKLGRLLDKSSADKGQGYNIDVFDTTVSDEDKCVVKEKTT